MATLEFEDKSALLPNWYISRSKQTEKAIHIKFATTNECFCEKPPLIAKVIVFKELSEFEDEECFFRELKIWLSG